MNKDEFYLKREILKTIIFDIVNEVNCNLEIRGSWKYGDFHISSDFKSSYSDLDLQATNSIRKEGDETDIRKEIFKRTQLKIPVSIHESKSLDNLSIHNAIDLAFLEYGYQIQKDNSTDKIYYLKAKFLLYLLRKDIDERYSSIPVRLISKDIEKLVDYKIGLIKSLNDELVKKIINKYFKTEKIYSLCLNIILPKSPSISDIQFMRFDILNKTQLDTYLLENIEKKYNSLIK